MNYYIIDYINSPKGESGICCKSIYSLDNVCKHCGTGAKLISNLKTKGLSNVKSDFFSTLDKDFIISENLYQFLVSKGINLNFLRKVLDSRNKELSFYHINTEISFPKFSPTSVGLITEHQCPVCKRNGYYSDIIIGNQKDTPNMIKQLKLIYQGISQEFLESSDIFNTWECLGVSNLKAEAMKVIRYAPPMLIVSERIKKAFEEYGVKNAVFEKVIIK